jgi:hypothetical protein
MAGSRPWNDSDPCSQKDTPAAPRIPAAGGARSRTSALGIRHDHRKVRVKDCRRLTLSDRPAALYRPDPALYGWILEDAQELPLTPLRGMQRLFEAVWPPPITTGAAKLKVEAPNPGRTPCEPLHFPVSEVCRTRGIGLRQARVPRILLIPISSASAIDGVEHPGRRHLLPAAALRLPPLGIREGLRLANWR